MLFDVSKIFEDNYSLLIKDSSRFHVFLCLGIIPFVVSIVLVIIGFKFSDNQFSNLITFIAIIVGFLINVTVIMITAEKDKGPIGKFLKNRNNANIFYTIIIGILITLLAIIRSGFETSIFWPFINSYYIIFSSVYYLIIYTLFIHFLIMILIIMKAFYALYK